MKWLLMLPVVLYQRLVSPLKPKCCRFEPSCSHYALGALRTHGALRGSWLTIRRLLRCQPFCEPGFDPVPPRRTRPGKAGGSADEATHSAHQRGR
ncbi:MAG: membrane protein insertion efficiency factor YidD [Planctomycetota bacterium]|nr:membrane protein insertion efficiency factor YidD [Planctomycetota bacterium]